MQIGIGGALAGFDHLQRTRFSDASFQTLAFEDRHDEVRQSVIFVDRLNRSDVRMNDRRGTFRFARKPFASGGTAGQLRCQLFDGGVSHQRCVLASHDDLHATASEDLHDLVTSEPTERVGMVGGFEKRRIGFQPVFRNTRRLEAYATE